MKLQSLVLLIGLPFVLAPIAHAQIVLSHVQLRYQFTVGQTLRYLVQSDPYFADPVGAIETTDTGAPYKPPVVQRLTEEVLAVGKDGAATVKVTLEPEPGFEGEGISAGPVTQILTVTPWGQALPMPGGAPVPEFLRDFFQAPFVSARPEIVIESRSRGHDGVLLQTTRCAERDHVIFDAKSGSLRRQVCDQTITFSLVMTERGKRGGADFGRVIPNVKVLQTMTIERRDDLALSTSAAPRVSDAVILPRSR